MLFSPVRQDHAGYTHHSEPRQEITAECGRLLTGGIFITSPALHNLGTFNPLEITFTPSACYPLFLHTKTLAVHAR